MDFGAVFEIVIVLFAVFGLVYFIKLLAESILMPKNIIVAARIFDEESAREVNTLMDILQNERGSKDMCVLINEKMSEDTELMETLYYSNVMFYIVKN